MGTAILSSFWVVIMIKWDSMCDMLRIVADTVLIIKPV